MRTQSSLGVAIIFSFLINSKFALSDDVCLLPHKVGFCRAMIRRWYYNPSKGGCDKFYWGGCGGNGNKFVTEQECMKNCQALSCTKKYQALGCYNNYLSSSIEPRGKEILNERDLRSKVFNGTLIDWLSWLQYLPSMLCRCAKRAASHGYRFFSIHNLGECWGTNEYQPNMLNKTAQCWDRFYGQQCNSSGDMCTGGPSTYYYYILT